MTSQTQTQAVMQTLAKAKRPLHRRELISLGGITGSPSSITVVLWKLARQGVVRKLGPKGGPNVRWALTGKYKEPALLRFFASSLGEYEDIVLRSARRIEELEEILEALQRENIRLRAQLRTLTRASGMKP